MIQKVKIMFVMLINLALFFIGESQIANPQSFYIQSRKFSVIKGEEFKVKVTPQRQNFTIPYLKAFKKKPDIGLSVYNLRFDYNPYFSIIVNQDRSTTQSFQFYLVGKPSQGNIFNQLFIMYIASEYQQFGIYTPGPKNTTVRLGSPTTAPNRTQQFIFNFKNKGNRSIFATNTNVLNIRVTVYLTGIQSQSETTSNGYSVNSAHFALSVSNISTNFYTVQVRVRSLFGQIFIKTIEFTIVYFDIQQIKPNYLMNAATIVGTNFGGTVHKSILQIPLQSFPETSEYENTLSFFFGISQIQCSGGQTINFLSVQRYNFNNNGRLQNLLLTLQTTAKTYIKRGVLNYVQYKPKICNDPNSCGIPCGDPTRPSFRISNQDTRCIPCLYFCQSCQTRVNCSSCPATRTINNNSICICSNKTLYDDQVSLECKNCFDSQFCKTCTRKSVCQTCYTQANFVFNSVLRVCQCQAGKYNSSTPERAMEFFPNIENICVSCAAQCLYCKQLKQCEACSVPYFLLPKPRTISDNIQTCAQICGANEKYNQFTLKCEQYTGDTSLFDQYGRLGFDWSYKNVNNELVVDLVFSQRNMTYYFYQNGKGYQYVRTTIQQNRRNQNGEYSVFYDDGNGYISGYSGSGPTSFQNQIINTKITQQANRFMFDQSALEGKYYGLGQAKFFSERYKQILKQKRIQFENSPEKYQIHQARYFDQYDIPFGKHQLMSTSISPTATFLDAIRSNLIFMVDNVSLPYTIRAISGNQFQLIVRPQKSYLKSNTSIIFKNPALVRSNQTALQTPMVSKQIDRLDYYSPSQLATAASLRDKTSIIVQILWGICKYILFIGFGWAVMPLMLILQYIFGHNYISTQLPLNLDYFLTSFADFRNPSILFNPQRNSFDAQVVNHPEIYKRIPVYQQFDRGIDFMKNSFQFFFTPLLSFGLQFLFIGGNYLIKKLCKKDFPLVSQYLQPRLPLHAAAYTLVQALPISFFFFGQLQDQRYTHPNLLKSVYPSFNAGMSYAAFFASAIIPLVLLTFIYHYFKNILRTGKFQLNKAKGTDEAAKLAKDPAMMNDPLWGGNVSNPLSYGFGSAVFYLPLLAGFVLSFFTKSYPWQLTGLLLGNAALGSFAGGSNHFVHKVPRFFWVGISALMVGYQLVHAGVGSNRALSTFDQWNTGYLGIGIIYAMLLAGIIFSGYLIYLLLKHLYNNIIKPFGCIRDLNTPIPMMKTPQQQQFEQKRDITMGRAQKRNNTMIKSKIQLIQTINSQQRLAHNRNQRQSNDISSNNNRVLDQDFVFQNQYEDGRALFMCKNSGQQYTFPSSSSNILLGNQPLRIDSQNNVFSYKNPNSKIFIGAIADLMRQNSSKNIIGGYQNQYQSQSRNQFQPNINIKNTSSNAIIEMTNMQKSSEQNLNTALNMVKNNNSKHYVNEINIDGKLFNYNYEDDQQGYFFISNFNNPTETYRFTEQQFVENYTHNKNKVNYNGMEWNVSKPQKDINNIVFYNLTDPSKNYNPVQLSYNELLNLLKKHQSIRNAHSTSLLPSNKSINQQFVGYNLMQPRQSVVFNKNNQQYLINGTIYDRVGENSEYIFLRNVETGQKLQIKKQQARIRSQIQMSQVGSMKQLLQNRLRQNQQIYFNNGRYLYKGMQNNYYSFIDLGNNQMKYFNADQLSKYLGLNNPTYIGSNNYVVQSYNNLRQIMPTNATQIYLLQNRANENVAIYQHPFTKQNYQINIEWLDLNQKVYVDSQGNLWHRGQKHVIEDQSPKQSPVRIGTNQSIQSQGHFLAANVRNDEYYDIKLLTADFRLSENQIPSDRHILEHKQDVIGSQVSNTIQKLKSIYPNCKILIENKQNPSQTFLVQFNQ